MWSNTELHNGVRKGRLFVVSGPSGVGKSSIIDRFLKEDEKSLFSISYTTRQRRPQEVDGRDYYFVDAATFQEMADGDLFLEWEDVHAHRYGTPRKEVADALTKGLDMVLDIDVKGALRVKEKCSEACLVFIEPPSKEDLVKRLSRQRREGSGPKDEEGRRRTCAKAVLSVYYS